MSKLWALVQVYLDSQGGMSARALARKTGVSPQTLDQWKTSRPEPGNLRRLARAIDTPYDVLLAAVMADQGYRTNEELMSVLADSNIPSETRERLMRHVAGDTPPTNGDEQRHAGQG